MYQFSQAEQRVTLFSVRYFTAIKYYKLFLPDAKKPEKYTTDITSSNCNI